MAVSKGKYWHGWNNDAANHFHVEPSTITLWHDAKSRTLDRLIKHNKLLDWLEATLIEKMGVPADVARNKVNENRIGYEKCLEN